MFIKKEVFPENFSQIYRSFLESTNQEFFDITFYYKNLLKNPCKPQDWFSALEDFFCNFPILSSMPFLRIFLFSVEKDLLTSNDLIIIIKDEDNREFSVLPLLNSWLMLRLQNLPIAFIKKEVKEAFDKFIIIPGFSFNSCYKSQDIEALACFYSFLDSNFEESFQNYLEILS